MYRCVLAVLLVVALGTPCSFADEPPVDCPAIRQDNRRRTNYPGESSMPIELIAVVQPVELQQPGDGRKEGMVVDVGKILYGHTNERRIRIVWPWRLSDKPQIVALAPDVFESKGTFQFKYELGTEEEWAAA